MLISIVFIIMSSKGFVLLQMSDFATLWEREREREREKVPHLVKKHLLVKSGGKRKLSQKDVILIIIMNRWRESSSKIYRTLLNAHVFTDDQESGW
jgi:hypothetical protein